MSREVPPTQPDVDTVGQPLVKAGVRLSPKSDVKIIAEVPKYVCRIQAGGCH